MAIADLVKSTLGPKGMDKILQSVGRGHGVTVTNDGATILRSIYVDNPAAKVLVDISRVQDEEVGDGTTSVVVLAGELLREAEKLVREFLVCFPPFSTSSGGRPFSGDQRPFFCFVWAVFFFFFLPSSFALLHSPAARCLLPLSSSRILPSCSLFWGARKSERRSKKRNKTRRKTLSHSFSSLQKKQKTFKKRFKLFLFLQTDCRQGPPHDHHRRLSRRRRRRRGLPIFGSDRPREGVPGVVPGLAAPRRANDAVVEDPDERSRPLRRARRLRGPPPPASRGRREPAGPRRGPRPEEGGRRPGGLVPGRGVHPRQGDRRRPAEARRERQDPRGEHGDGHGQGQDLRRARARRLYGEGGGARGRREGQDARKGTEETVFFF